MTVYKFNIFYDGDEEKQTRFVCASDEEEAYNKIEKYRKNKIKQCFADFKYFLLCVEIENVIC